MLSTMQRSAGPTRASGRARAAPKRRVALHAAAPATTTGPKVATLPGTPESGPLPPERLLELAKAFSKDRGIQDPSILADDFRFEFPVISLPKDEYVKAVRSFKLQEAFPDLQSETYDFRVDPYEPQRVWYTVRSAGTHTGTLNFGSVKLDATGKSYLSGPECCSVTFNQQGKVTSFTGGYPMDRRVGNTGGYGAMFGVLTSVGYSIPPPGSTRYVVATKIGQFQQWLKKTFGGGN